jgi:hypothetical protein
LVGLSSLDVQSAEDSALKLEQKMSWIWQDCYGLVVHTVLKI